MKHRVAELEGALLDTAVAMAEGWERQAVDGIDCWWSSDAKDNWWRSDIRNATDRVQWFRPSVDWGNAGPIIERERISVVQNGEKLGDSWDAYHQAGYYGPDGQVAEPRCSGRDIATGPTYLIAAMRAYVASKYGETVELP